MEYNRKVVEWNSTLSHIVGVMRIHVKFTAITQQYLHVSSYRIISSNIHDVSLDLDSFSLKVEVPAGCCVPSSHVGCVVDDDDHDDGLEDGESCGCSAALACETMSRPANF